MVWLKLWFGQFLRLNRGGEKDQYRDSRYNSLSHNPRRFRFGVEFTLASSEITR